MKTFELIYNMGEGAFFENKDLTVADIYREDKYVSIGKLRAEDLEDVFEIMNIRHPEYLVESVKNIFATTPHPLIHTSMSVGDIAVEEVNSFKRIYYQCCSVGWKEVK